jgi:hypothetical protein
MADGIRETMERVTRQVLAPAAIGWQPGPTIATPASALVAGIRALASGPVLSASPGADALLGALRASILVTLGENVWGELIAALPSPADPEAAGQFAYGLISGAAETARQLVVDEVRGYRDLMLNLTQFYSAALDDELLMAGATAWLDSDPQNITAAMQMLAERYPRIYMGLTALAEFSSALEQLIAPLLEDVDAASALASRALRQAVEWILAVPRTFAQLIRDEVAAIVSRVENPEEQGRIFGRYLGYIAVVLPTIAMNFYPVLRGGLAVSRGIGDVSFDIVTAVADVAVPEEIVRGSANARVAGLAAVRTRIIGPMREAVELYGSLAYRTGSYRDLKETTGLFNGMAKEATGAAFDERQYIAIRLDAHHLAPAEFHSRFRVEMRQYFGWNSPDDMESIAIHTERHIRSGRGMSAPPLGLLGAESEASLTVQLRRFLRERDRTRPFGRVRDFMEACREFYVTYDPNLWRRMETRFNELINLLPP